MEYCHVWAGAGATYWNVRQATKTDMLVIYLLPLLNHWLIVE